MTDIIKYSTMEKSIVLVLIVVLVVSAGIPLLVVMLVPSDLKSGD